MGITGIILAAVIVGGTGLFIGVFLGIAGKKFAVETDEREDAILEVLPGNNCGGCGYAGAPVLPRRSWQARRRSADVPSAALLSQSRSERSWASMPVRRRERPHL